MYKRSGVRVEVRGSDFKTIKSSKLQSHVFSQEIGIIYFLF